jgi:hypothetical protein
MIQKNKKSRNKVYIPVQDPNIFTIMTATQPTSPSSVENTTKLTEQYEFYMIMKQPLSDTLFSDPDNIHALQSMHKPTFELYQDEAAFQEAMKNILYTDQNEHDQTGKQAETWNKLHHYYQDFAPDWQEYIDPGIDKRYWTELWAAAYEGVQQALKEKKSLCVKPSFQVFVRRLHHEKKECDRILRTIHDKHNKICHELTGNRKPKVYERDHFNHMIIKVITSPDPSIKATHTAHSFENKIESFAEKIQNQIIDGANADEQST